MKNKLHYFFLIHTLLALDFSLLTYNVHALHPIIAGDNPKSRIQSILEESKDYDFILIQENWIFSSEYLSSKLPNHSWVVSSESKFSWPIRSLINSNGSGLSLGILGSHEIINIHEEKFDRCSGWLGKANDCLATKGFQHIQIKIDNQILDIYNTHLDAGGNSKDREVREYQIKYLVNYISENSIGHAVILAGDLNVNFLTNEKSILDWLMDELDFKIIDWMNTYDGKPLDYILFRGSESLDIFSDEYGIDNRLNGLSDHPPIKAVFEFKSK